MMALDAYEARVLARARAELELEILDRAKKLISTESLDFSDYRARVGFIKGIQHAFELIDAVEQEFRHQETGQESQKQQLSRYED